MIMKYYIVALFDKDSYTNLSPVQRKYSKKFRGNRNSPLPYLIRFYLIPLYLILPLS